MENLQVRLTRSTDRTMSVAERIKAAGDFKPDCLISLHVNAGFGKQASGYEVYFPGFRQNASREEATPRRYSRIWQKTDPSTIP